MPARQTVLKPLGLITRPNEYGQYAAGALAIASNVLFRDAGEMIVTKDVSNPRLLGAANDVLRKLYALDNGIVWAATRTAGLVWTMSFNGTAGAFPAADGAVVALSDTGFISPLRMRDHFQVNSQRGMIVSDVMAPATAADRTFRKAGMPQPQVSFIGLNAASGGALAANTTVGYAAVWRRNFPKGYELVSAPSPVYRVANTSASAVNVSLTISSDPALSGLAAGDIIEVYRTDAITGTAVTIDPGTTCRLVETYTVTAADIAAGNFVVTDTQAPEPLGATPGRELYTNPGQQGALAANRQANTSKLTAQYKGYAFYANVLERAQWIFSVPAGIADSTLGLTTPFERTHGIGVRLVTAATTSGSATVTGVSAAHMAGIKVGQLLASAAGGAFPPGGAEVQSVNTGLGTITFNNPASATVAVETLNIVDMFEIDGQPLRTTSLGLMLQSLAETNRYEITVDQTVWGGVGTAGRASNGFTVAVEPLRAGNSTNIITVRATNGANYRPSIPEWTATAQTFAPTPRPNMLQWSHEQQPEHVPPSNSAFVGSGEIVGLQSTRDALWIFCTDGLFRLSGEGGQWRIDQLDTTLILSAPQCCTALREAVYAYTNRGLVRIADDGFDELSEQSIGDTLVGAAYVETAALIVERDESSDEIHVVDTGVAGGAPTLYVLATRFQCWSKLSFPNVTALAYQRIPTNPATQPNGWLIIGRSPLGGAQPLYGLFDQSPAVANLAATIQFQPFYSDDPLVLKQWIDATWIFQLADATRVLNSSWLGVADGSAVLTAWLNGDARATFGIPRSVAVAPTLSPGLSIPSGVFTPPVCKGVSLRFRSLTEQQAYR